MEHYGHKLRPNDAGIPPWRRSVLVTDADLSHQATLTTPPKLEVTVGRT